MPKPMQMVRYLLLAVFVGLVTAGKATAFEEDSALQWGGHLRGQASAASQDRFIADGDSQLDGFAQLRLKARCFFSDALSFESHYEAAVTGGDSRRRAQTGSENASVIRVPGGGGTVTDARRLFDLTHVIDQGDSHLFYHRLDRLHLDWQASGFFASIGRMALTWGNGLVFNPLDLFNPFAPADFERDYKPGDDMLYARFQAGEETELEALVVGRRNIESGKVESQSASAAIRAHRAFGDNGREVDLILARHYDQWVVGAGTIGFLGEAVVRADMLWALSGEDHQPGYLSGVANIDFSWQWLEKNCYGLLEVFYAGIGDDDYIGQLRNQPVLDRLRRGELFTLGRWYTAAQWQVELHPLFQAFVTGVVNLQDPSGFFQPYAVWNVHSDWVLTAGAVFNWGGRGDEYGRLELPGGQTVQAADSLFIRATWHF